MKCKQYHSRRLIDFTNKVATDVSTLGTTAFETRETRGANDRREVEIRMWCMS